MSSTDVRSFGSLQDASAATATPLRIPFHNTYARLPEHFFARVQPTRVAAPRLIQLNAALAEQLGLDPAALASPEGVETLAGNRVAEGSEPLAQAYAGHQFGGFVPQLGDGRANLLGEVVAPDGRRFDLQLKGAGPTPFSRRGDGRAAVGPVLREYLVSEAMAALGVPTTRALAAVATGEPVYREGALPGAVLTRVAASHLRVGTFQFFAARGDTDALRTLADYAIARHYPAAAGAPAAADAAEPYRALLDGVIGRQARLVAQWMTLGFVHGVMNTDNTSISGETIDYGPCAFMEAFDPRQVFSSIDMQGRYGFTNQPHAMHWNLTRLAEALLPLLAANEAAAVESATEALATFAPQFEAAYGHGLGRKLGFTNPAEGDLALAEELLALMAASHADFTLTFSRLTEAAAAPDRLPAARELFADTAAFDRWAARWQARLSAEPAGSLAATMRAANPVHIPRNHQVQAMIDAAVRREDFEPFRLLLEAVTHPFDPRPEWTHLAVPAQPGERVTQTFCGT